MGRRFMVSGFLCSGCTGHPALLISSSPVVVCVMDTGVRRARRRPMEAARSHFRSYCISLSDAAEGRSMRGLHTDWDGSATVSPQKNNKNGHLEQLKCIESAAADWFDARTMPAQTSWGIKVKFVSLSVHKNCMSPT